MKRRTTRPVSKPLRAIAERFAALTQVAYDGVFIYDSGVILNATPGAAALFGRAAQELNDCRVADLVASECELLLLHLDAVNRTSWPAIALRGDGSRVPVEMSVQASLTLDGRRVQVVALRDATRDEHCEYLTDRAVSRRRSTPEFSPVLD